MTNYLSHEQDTVRYLACTIRNNFTDRQRIAEFSQALTAPLLEKASDYYVLIQSFTIDRISLPIFTYNDNYIITFDVGGVDSTLVVPFISRDSTSKNQSVYSINQFMDMLNSAFKTLQTMSGATGDLGTGPPFIQYDPNDSNKFNLYIPTGYTADIFFNRDLLNLFKFDAELFGVGIPKAGRIINKVDPFNIINISGTNYNIIENQEDTLWRLNDVRGLILSTNTLPITKEIISFEDQQSNYISTNTLQRFFEIINISEGVQSIPFEYVSQYDNYLVDLNSPNALNNIGFSINVLYKDDSIKPLQLEPGAEASVKFKFIKKAFFFERDLHQNKLTGNIGMKQLRRQPD